MRTSETKRPSTKAPHALPSSGLGGRVARRPLTSPPPLGAAAGLPALSLTPSISTPSPQAHFSAPSDARRKLMSTALSAELRQKHSVSREFVEAVRGLCRFPRRRLAAPSQLRGERHALVFFLGDAASHSTCARRLGGALAASKAPRSLLAQHKPPPLPPLLLDRSAHLLFSPLSPPPLRSGPFLSARTTRSRSCAARTR